MRMNKKPYPLMSLCTMKGRIDPEPDYQRPAVWTTKQKQLLLDSILREYDVPKVYWQIVKDADGKLLKYDVIDGQQRLRTIWEFQEDGFALAKDADPIDGMEVKGQKYSQLPLEIVEKFNAYALDVVIVEEAVQNQEEDEVRDMFLRLQNGTTLKAQEKRNAMTGAMRDFVKEMAAHPFFGKCHFSKARFNFDHLAAQTICLEVNFESNGNITSVRDRDLNKLYRDQTDFDGAGKTAKKVKRVYDFLNRAFPEKTPELERYNVINLYILVSKLLENYVADGLEQKVHDWFIDFEAKRRADYQKPEEEQDSQLINYRQRISSSTDAEDSIQKRIDLISKLFFSAYPDIELKDTQRAFTHEQRLAIFRNDNETCQLRIKCDGRKITWSDWHADHKTPHTRGGKTVVSNGQVACPECNHAKGGRDIS
jgi:hypothetical protein